MKKLVFGLVLLSGLCLGIMNVDAATFESMKKNIESGDGVVYNPEFNRIMTDEETSEFIKIIETEKEAQNISSVTPEIYTQAFENIASSENLDVHSNNTTNSGPLVQTFGGGLPTTPYMPTGLEYRSNVFSGSGWRYSGYYFKFSNYNANYLFGVKAEADSFYFTARRNSNFSQAYQVVVQANRAYVYFPSTDRGQPLNGFFSTQNPLPGTRYWIY
ncbi:hypothetical protein [Carnobacterium maltaromaticum]|uniref:hypothetical protein n=1 Tax=Carnobacterium maltaromaticum TaxID=2751 RepID=UPI0039BE7AD9